MIALKQDMCSDEGRVEGILALTNPHEFIQEKYKGNDGDEAECLEYIIKQTFIPTDPALLMSEIHTLLSKEFCEEEMDNEIEFIMLNYPDGIQWVAPHGRKLGQWAADYFFYAMARAAIEVLLK